ncbi:hypothetical protein [Legionella gresilensis]|uniref:hypothetical protein n=1 Tax=Legionella gresilensis TaxID=91823 RepID=UPI001041890B|nr:hypothetical protein [Legionella gresilensis]
MFFVALNPLLFAEESAYRQAQRLNAAASEVLEGNYINFSLLVNIFNSLSFKKHMQSEPALKALITKLGAECEKQANTGQTHTMVLQALLYTFDVGYSIDYPKAKQYYWEILLQ